MTTMTMALMDEMFRWIASALRFQRAFPTLLIHRPRYFVRAYPPSVN